MDGGAPRRRDGALFEGDIEPLRRQQRSDALRPFDQGDALAPGLLDAKLIHILRGHKAIEIEVPDWRLVGELIGLDQSESWARHLLNAGAERADESPREAGLTAAKGTPERNDIAHTNEASDARRQLRGSRLVGQIENELRHHTLSYAVSARLGN